VKTSGKPEYPLGCIALLAKSQASLKVQFGGNQPGFVLLSAEPHGYLIGQGTLGLGFL
jgi:hypothetical protein